MASEKDIMSYCRRCADPNLDCLEHEERHPDCQHADLTLKLGGYVCTRCRKVILVYDYKNNNYKSAKRPKSTSTRKET